MDKMTREEAIADIRDNIKPVVGGKSLDMAIEALEQAPCTDAISRQAVIDMTGLSEWFDSSDSYNKFVSALSELPSVKPQYTDAEIQKMQNLEFAEIQKAYEIGKEEGSSEKPNKWIPVSERLPEGSDIVLLSLPPHIDPDGEECSASVICGHYIGGRNAEWGLSDGDTFGYGLVSVR